MGEVDDSGVKRKVQEWLEWDKVCLLLLTPALSVRIIMIIVVMTLRFLMQ